MSNQQLVLRLYSIRDLKLNTFMAPFFCSSDDEAKRILSEQVNFKPSLMCSYPEDYELYFVGTFDTFSGAIDTIDDVNFLICKLSELKSNNPDDVKLQEILKEVNTKKLICKLSELKSNNPDDIKYQEILKEVKLQDGRVSASVLRCSEALSEYQKKIADFDQFYQKQKKILDDKVAEIDEKLSVELYTPVNSKKSLLRRLFS